jgi:hypothetical protein
VSLYDATACLCNVTVWSGTARPRCPIHVQEQQSLPFDFSQVLLEENVRLHAELKKVTLELSRQRKAKVLEDLRRLEEELR